MAKHKQHGIAGALGVRKPSTVPLIKGGAFQWGKIDAAHHEDKWEDMPKGWTSSSRDKYAASMAKEECEDNAKEGPVDTCMDKIDGHVSDPGAFCASLHDRVTGTTHWRGKGK